MKKILKENALKTTIFGNLFALLGPIYFLIFWSLLFLLFTFGFEQSDPGFSFIIIMGDITQGYLIVSAIVIFGFVLELLFRHRIKKEFFKENKIYNIFFYIGLSLTLFSFLCIALIYYL